MGLCVQLYRSIHEAVFLCVPAYVSYMSIFMSDICLWGAGQVCHFRLHPIVSSCCHGLKSHFLSYVDDRALTDDPTEMQILCCGGRQCNRAIPGAFGWEQLQRRACREELQRRVAERSSGSSAVPGGRQGTKANAAHPATWPGLCYRHHHQQLVGGQARAGAGPPVSRLTSVAAFLAQPKALPELSCSRFPECTFIMSARYCSLNVPSVQVLLSQLDCELLCAFPPLSLTSCSCPAQIWPVWESFGKVCQKSGMDDINSWFTALAAE